MFQTTSKLISASFIAMTLTACGSAGDSATGLSANNPTANTPVVKDASTVTKSAVDAANSSAQFASTSAAFAGQGPDVTTKSFALKAINETINCTANTQLRSYCVGQAVVSSNLSTLGGGNNGIAAGTYLNIEFTAFRLLTAPLDQTTTGAVSITFLDTFTSSSLLNGSATIKVDITAPKPEVHTNLKLTFKQLSATTASNGVTLNGGASVSSTTEPASDVTFKTWRTLGATPQPGSIAIIASGNESTTIQVVSVIGSQVTFDVITTVNGIAQPTKRVVMEIVNGLPVYRIL
jgi:hypothetical protein